MECIKEHNLKHCNCSYQCAKKGKCCICLRNHLDKGQLPACCFPDEVEKTYDRSFKKFAELVNKGKI